MKLKFDINVEKENGESACVGKKRRRKREREESNITVKRGNIRRVLLEYPYINMVYFGFYTSLSSTLLLLLHTILKIKICI
jgi:hypothetical protein